MSELTRFAGYLGRRNWRNVIGNRYLSIGGGSFGVHNALGNPLSIEVGVLLKQLPVLREDRTRAAGRQ